MKNAVFLAVVMLSTADLAGESWTPVGQRSLETSRTLLEAVWSRAESGGTLDRVKAKADQGWLAVLGALPTDLTGDARTEAETELRALSDQKWQSFLTSHFLDEASAGGKIEAYGKNLQESDLDRLVAGWEARVTAALPGSFATMDSSPGQLYKKRYIEELEALFLQRACEEVVPIGPNADRFEALAARLVTEAGSGIPSDPFSRGIQSSALPNPGQSPGSTGNPTFQDLLSEGLKYWDEAENVFATEKASWERQAGETYRHGVTVWESARVELARNQKIWEDGAARILAEGRTAWSSRMTEFQEESRKRLVAEELAVHRAEVAREARMGALVSLYGQARLLVNEAYRNGSYWFERLPGAVGPWITEGFSPGGLKSWAQEPHRNAGDLETEDYREALYWAGQMEASQDQAAQVTELLVREWKSLDATDDRQGALTDARNRLDWWDREVRVSREIVDVSADMAVPQEVEARLVSARNSAAAGLTDAEKQLAVLVRAREVSETLAGEWETQVSEAKQNLQTASRELETLRLRLGRPTSSAGPETEDPVQLKDHLDHLRSEQSLLISKERGIGATYREALRNYGDTLDFQEFLLQVGPSTGETPGLSSGWSSFLEGLNSRQLNAGKLLAEAVATHPEPGTLAPALGEILRSSAADLRMDQRTAAEAVVNQGLLGSPGPIPGPLLRFLEASLSEVRTPGQFGEVGNWSEPVEVPGISDKLAAAAEDWDTFLSSDSRLALEISGLERSLEVVSAPELTPEVIDDLEFAVDRAEESYQNGLASVGGLLNNLALALEETEASQRAVDRGTETWRRARETLEDRDRVLAGFTSRLAVGEDQGPALVVWEQAVENRNRAAGVVEVLEAVVPGAEWASKGPVSVFQDKTAAVLETLRAADLWKERSLRLSSQLDLRFQEYTQAVNQFLSGQPPGLKEWVAGTGTLRLSVDSEFRFVPREAWDQALNPAYWDIPDQAGPVEGTWYSQTFGWLGALAEWSARDPGGFTQGMKTWGLALGHLVSQVDQANSPSPLGPVLSGFSGTDEELDEMLVTDPALRAALQGKTDSGKLSSLQSYRPWIRERMAAAYSSVTQDPVQAGLFQTAVVLRLTGALRTDTFFEDAVVEEASRYLAGASEAKADQSLASSKASGVIAGGFLTAAACAWWNPVLAGAFAAMAVAPGAAALDYFNDSRTFQAASDRFEAVAQGKAQAIITGLNTDKLQNLRTREGLFHSAAEAFEAWNALVPDLGTLDSLRQSQGQSAAEVQQFFQTRAAREAEALLAVRNAEVRYLSGDPEVPIETFKALVAGSFGEGSWVSSTEQGFWVQTILDLTSGPLTPWEGYENAREGLVMTAASLVLDLGKAAGARAAQGLSDEIRQKGQELIWSNLRWEERMKAAVAQGRQGWARGGEDLEKNYRLWDEEFRTEYEAKAQLWRDKNQDLSDSRIRWTADLLRGVDRSEDRIWGLQQTQAARTASQDHLFDFVSDLYSKAPDPGALLGRITGFGPTVQSLRSVADAENKPNFGPPIPFDRTILPDSNRNAAVELLGLQARRTAEVGPHLTKLVATQAWDRVAQGRDRIRRNLVDANQKAQSQMERLYQGAGFLVRAGQYSRQSEVGSTIFETLYESQTVEGYRSLAVPELDLPPPRTADPDDAQKAWEGLESLEASVLGANGRFYQHLGTVPELSQSPDWSNKDLEAGFRASFIDPGSGELGRLVGWFEYFGARASGGWSLVAQGMHNKRLWDDQGQGIEAPTFRTVASTAVSLVGSYVAGAFGGALMVAGLDAMFTSSDVSSGADSSEAWANWGKRTLIGGASAGLSWGTQGVLHFVEGAVGWEGVALKTGFYGGQALVHRGISTAATSLSFGDSGVGWDSSAFWNSWTESPDTALSSVAMAMSGAATRSIVNLDGVGFFGDKLEAYNQVGTLVGALASTGTGFLMTGEALVNLVSLNSQGLLELSLGQGNVGLRLGAGGADLGPQAWASGLGGLGVWAENDAISHKVDGDLRIGLRSLSSVGSGPVQDLYRSLMDGSTEVQISDIPGARAQTLVRPDGGRTLILGPSGPESGLFDNSVVLAHEALRDGTWNGTQGQLMETRTAVLAHMMMADTIRRTYTGGLGADAAAEAALLNAYSSGQIGPGTMVAYMDAAYDSSADYWKLMGDGRLIRDGDGWLRDENGQKLKNAAGETIGARDEVAGLLNILFGGTSQRTSTAFTEEQWADAQSLLLSSGYDPSGKSPVVLAAEDLSGRFGTSLATQVFVNAFDRESDRLALGGPLGECPQDRLTTLVESKRRFFLGDRLLFRPESVPRLGLGAPFQPDSGYVLAQGQHTGIDISGSTPGAAAGVGAYALFEGRVVDEKFNTTSSGYSVTIEYGFTFEGIFYSTGIQAQYMHFREESPLVVGQMVAATDLVGNIGNTGRSGGPHLHYQLMGDLGGQTSRPDSPLWNRYQGRRDTFLSQIGAPPSSSYSTVPTSTQNYWVSNGSLRNFYYNPNLLLDRIGIGLAP